MVLMCRYDAPVYGVIGRSRRRLLPFEPTFVGPDDSGPDVGQCAGCNSALLSQVNDGVRLTSYAMLCFEICEELPSWSRFALSCFFQALADTLAGVTAGRNVKQLLIGGGVLHDGGCLAFPELPHEVTGTATLSMIGPWHLLR